MAHLKHGTSSHLLSANGHLVADCDCCGATCSTDCSACPDLTATVSGLTGNCLCANGVYPITRTDCRWEYYGVTAGDPTPFSVIVIQFECIDGQWKVTVVCQSTCVDGDPTYTGDFNGVGALAPRAGDQCGRLGSYNVIGSAVEFCNGNITVVIS